MTNFQDAEDKITTALLLLAGAAELLNEEFETRQHHDKSAYETMCERRIFQIHAAVTFLSEYVHIGKDLFPDAKTLKFYPEPGSPNVTE